MVSVDVVDHVYLFLKFGCIFREPFVPHAIESIRLILRTGCHTIQTKLTGKVDIFNLAARELPSLVTSGLSFTSVQTDGTHWLADAVMAGRCS